MRGNRGRAVDVGRVTGLGHAPDGLGLAVCSSGRTTTVMTRHGHAIAARGAFSARRKKAARPIPVMRLRAASARNAAKLVILRGSGRPAAVFRPLRRNCAQVQEE